ncbi:MAG: response regulator transcription factor [Eubacteriales bacterium]|nr:response regulator transcription factor [Eubacteriales bacterium]MDD3882983.1 response regulator transcription factor [Eubacteriales bacterium]MDD4513469.1 response regulator transcription factor [Eubacteriales bacterium]
MIYVLEDDAGIRSLEVYALTQAGYTAAGFERAADMELAMKSSLPELVVLDVMLPDKDGNAVLADLRKSPDTAEIPVIMVTAKGEEMDKVKALDGGADDYVVKPFGVLELISRVRALLRRAPKGEKRTEFTFGSVTLSEEKHTVSVGGAPVELTNKEFALLLELMRHPGVVLTRDMLLSRVWDIDYLGDSRTVDVHVRTLRQKLGEGGGIIGTVRGVGYRLEEAYAKKDK